MTAVRFALLALIALCPALSAVIGIVTGLG